MLLLLLLFYYSLLYFVYLKSVFGEFRTRKLGFRGKGVITRAVHYLCQWAFFEKDFNRIQVRCAVGNQPSNAIPQRLGFTLEGTERDGELLSSGEYMDINVYSLLRKELELK